MPTPFPGMDPYLEQPALWPDLHNSLIVALRDELAPRLRPRYYVAIEERTYTLEPGDLVLAGRADLAVVGAAGDTSAPMLDPSAPGGVIVSVELPDQIRETYLEVRAAGSGQVITLLEMLSPTNKRPGEGRGQYLRKRRAVLASLTHLVEIDLLRASEPMPVSGWNGRSDYRLMISRGELRPRALLLPFSLRQAIPAFALPLRPGDDEPQVELGLLLHALYDRGGYDLRLDYAAEPDPPLAGDDAAWANTLLRDARLR